MMAEEDDKICAEKVEYLQRFVFQLVKPKILAKLKMPHVSHKID